MGQAIKFRLMKYPVDSHGATRIGYMALILYLKVRGSLCHVIFRVNLWATSPILWLFFFLNLNFV